MEKLHPDVKLNILSRLPTESIYQCKLVSKPWRDLLCHIKVGLLFAIGNENFSGDVQLFYGDEYNEINIDDDDDSCKTLTKIDHPVSTNNPFYTFVVGSCNGLVCFLVFHHAIMDPVYICNPFTSEYLHLPRLTTCEKSSHCLVSGFGYVYSTNEYKVVRIHYEFDQLGPVVGRVQVYTLGGGSGWRNKENITHCLRGYGVFANGCLHWMDMPSKRNIVAFNLADEKFQLLPKPPCLLEPSNFRFTLQNLGGCLCVICADEGKCVDIWALKNDKKNTSRKAKDQDEYHSWSWSKEFTIPCEGPKGGTNYRPFALTKSNKVLLWYRGILSCYDPKTATLKKLGDDNSSWRFAQAIPYMKSLVSLEALGEKSERRR